MTIAYLLGINGSFIQNNVQRSINPGIPVGVTNWWAIQVKDHGFIGKVCELQVVAQPTNGLIHGGLPIVLRYGIHGGKRWVLENTETIQ